MSNPKCLFFKRSDKPSSEELDQLASSIPLVNECKNCKRLQDNTLEKMCWKEL